jgi:hypothetical protein
MLQDRLNTGDLLVRKNFHVEDPTCVLCDDGILETVTHLFFRCDFSQIFWWTNNMEWNIDLPFLDMMEEGGKESNASFPSRCWSLWIQRNRFLFDNIQFHWRVS